MRAKMTLLIPNHYQHILRIHNTNIDGKRMLLYALTAIKGLGRRYAKLVAKNPDVDVRKRAWRCVEEEAERVLSILLSQRRYKIPDWFLNWQADLMAGHYRPLTTANLDLRLCEDLKRLKRSSMRRAAARSAHNQRATSQAVDTVGITKNK